MKNFKLIYDKLPNDQKLNGSYSGLPTNDDQDIILNNISKETKLIYEGTRMLNNSVDKPVPNTGYINRIYFNTNLPNEEIIKCIPTLDDIKNLYSATEWEYIQKNRLELAINLINASLIYSDLTNINPDQPSDKAVIVFCINQSIFVSFDGFPDNAISVFDVKHGWNNKVLKGNNFIDIDNTWMSKNELDKFIADQLGLEQIPEYLLKPGYFNNQLSKVAFIKETGDIPGAKTVKVLKASTKNFPTSDDKEICTISALMGTVE